MKFQAKCAIVQAVVYFVIHWILYVLGSRTFGIPPRELLKMAGIAAFASLAAWSFRSGRVNTLVFGGAAGIGALAPLLGELSHLTPDGLSPLLLVLVAVQSVIGWLCAAMGHLLAKNLTRPATTSEPGH